MRTVGTLVVVLAAGMALAQGQSLAPSQPAGTPPPASASMPAAFEKASDVPDGEKLARSTQAVGVMKEVLRQVLGKVEEARRTKDVVKLNCANEKLTQIKGLLRISEQAEVSLQEALATKETSTSDHEFTKVMIARQKVTQLRAEAEECIGQLAFRTDENLFVEVEEPENLPGGDPTRPPPPEDVVVRPPPASPLL
ncbi:hypothetical protein JY651_29315 [Pyxidicoccus parkwayensis]|jgi:hypothetical protein|uniref:Uncharacterized protein n=1 Tax=Pyxidicoccus parkwayensis TaxID=2813578 RepID=A0ABX7NLW0_9BACT|nr:hypothetical protein [Pyxidicoccus parkwaysis]QSQ19416.1 hypothetical protein JY651_29315 [Pyxidicoccus parkwaysis]